jgi:hypothetical protein
MRRQPPLHFLDFCAILLNNMLSKRWSNIKTNSLHFMVAENVGSWRGASLRGMRCLAVATLMLSTCDAFSISPFSTTDMSTSRTSRPGVQQHRRSPASAGGVSAVRMIASQREAKQKIMVLASKTKNNNQAIDRDADKLAILDCIRQLESANTCKNPAESPLLSGKWSLLYTVGKEGDERARLEGVIGSTVTDVSEASGKTERGAAGRALGIVPYGNYQDIYLDQGLVYNRAELGVLGQK